MEDSSKCYYQYHCNYDYWNITNSSDLFDQSILSSQTKCPFIGGANQLWRNQLMGHAIKEKGEYERVHFSVVHHPENNDLQKTIAEYEQMLSDKGLFSVFTSEQILDAALKIQNDDISEWAKWYSGLYRIG
jgi:hypothetical protein